MKICHDKVELKLRLYDMNCVVETVKVAIVQAVILLAAAAVTAAVTVIAIII